MSLDPIDQLLCDCLGRMPDAELAISLASVSSEEWEALVLRSQSHGVSPQCYKRLKDPALSRFVPSPVLAELKKKYMQNARRNTLYYHGLSFVLNDLHRGGISVILLKGAYLAEHVYKNIALRIIGDVDILLQPKDVENASKIISRLGYTTRPFWFEAENESSRELPPFSKPNAADLDVHWGLEVPDNTFNIGLEQLWLRAIPVKISGVDVLSLDHEDLLLHLCLHASFHHHFVSGLRSLCDIAEVVCEFENSLDWNIIIERSKEWKIDRCVFLSLYLIRELFHTSISPYVMEALYPLDFSENFVDLALQQIFPSKLHSGRVSEYLVRFLKTQNLREKIKYWFQRVFPTRKMISRKYPVDPGSPKVFLYYPVRLYDLLALYGRTVWHHLIQETKTKDLVHHVTNVYNLVDWLSKRDQ